MKKKSISKVESYKNDIKELRLQLECINKENSNLKSENINLKMKLNDANLKYRKVTSNEIKLKNDINIIKFKYHEYLNEIENRLHDVKKEQDRLECENNSMSRSYNEIQKKYKALSTSKLGQLTLKYWNIKRRIVK